MQKKTKKPRAQGVGPMVLRADPALRRAVKFMKDGFGSSDLVSQPGDLPGGEIYFGPVVLLTAEVFELDPLEVIGLVLGQQTRKCIVAGMKAWKAARHG